MKYNKIEALLKLKGLNMSNYAKYMNVSRQQISNKKKNDTFRADELIKLAELTDTTLAFNDKETGKTLIEFEVKIFLRTFCFPLPQVITGWILALSDASRNVFPRTNAVQGENVLERRLPYEGI